MVLAARGAVTAISSGHIALLKLAAKTFHIAKLWKKKRKNRSLALLNIEYIDIHDASSNLLLIKAYFI